jgi:dTDP-glucose 4,6-dehydratase
MLYSKDTVLLTGGAGFIGHHVVDHIFKHTDWNIVFLDRLDCSGNLNRITDLQTWSAHKSRCRFVYHDLKAPLNSQLIKQIGDVDYIFHLAAATHVDRSIEDPMSFVMDNIVGTVNLLDYARIVKPKQFIYFSTDEVFGPAPGTTAYKEEDRYDARNPYAATKAGAEQMCISYHNTFKVPVRITRCMNVFGARQHPEKFIPNTIKKVRDGETVVIHSDPTKTVPGSRFYIHASNVADAVLFVAQNGTNGEKYNIVGEKEVNNLELARAIANIQGAPLKYEMMDFHSARPGHDLRYGMSGEKLAKMGWVPPATFEQGLEETVRWTLAHTRWLLA